MMDEESQTMKIAREFTLSGIDRLIGEAERNLSELDRLDDELGVRGAEVRERSRARYRQNLAEAQKARQIRVAAGGS